MPLSRQALAGTPMHSGEVSHPLGPGEDFERIEFNLLGRSPLISHFLYLRGKPARRRQREHRLVHFIKNIRSTLAETKVNSIQSSISHFVSELKGFATSTKRRKNSVFSGQKFVRLPREGKPDSVCVYVLS